MLRTCCLVLLLLAAGCSERVVPSGAPAGQTGPAGTSLAYEHTVAVSISAQRISPRMAAIREACVSEAIAQCSLLRFEETTGSYPSGLVVVRLAPEGVEPMVELASEGGSVGSHVTRAEDLAAPVADSRREREQLESQRSLLLEFKARDDLSVADMLSIARELAIVETRLAETEQGQAALARRIDTNLLTIRYSSDIDERHWASVGAAIKDSTGSFVGGIVEAIELVAFGLPFLLIAFPLALLWRWVWRRATKGQQRDSMQGRATNGGDAVADGKGNR